MATKKKAPVGGFDFATARQRVEQEEAGVTFKVRDEDGSVLLYDGQPVTITVRGVHSPTFRRLADEFKRTYYRDLVGDVSDPAERQRIMDEASEKWDQAFDERVRAPNVIGWTGFLDGGEPVEVTPERAIEAVRSPFLRKQIVVAQEAPERFFAEASES